MTTGDKAIKVLEAIAAICNDTKNMDEETGEYGTPVRFTNDNGTTLLTVHIGGRHCHVGTPHRSLDHFVDTLYRVFVEDSESSPTIAWDIPIERSPDTWTK